MNQLGENMLSKEQYDGVVKLLQQRNSHSTSINLSANATNIVSNTPDKYVALLVSNDHK